MSVGADICVVGATVIVFLEFAVTLAYTGDVLVGVLINALTGLSFALIIAVTVLVIVVCLLFVILIGIIEFGVLAGMRYVKVSEAVARPLEDSMRCCRAPFSCSTITLLDCERVLQIRMPSCHV